MSYLRTREENNDENIRQQFRERPYNYIGLKRLSMSVCNLLTHIHVNCMCFIKRDSVSFVINQLQDEKYIAFSLKHFSKEKYESTNQIMQKCKLCFNCYYCYHHFNTDMLNVFANIPILYLAVYFE